MCQKTSFLNLLHSQIHSGIDENLPSPKLQNAKSNHARLKREDHGLEYSRSGKFRAVLDHVPLMAITEVIVDHAHRLHQRITRGWPDKGPAPFFSSLLSAVDSGRWATICFLRSRTSVLAGSKRQKNWPVSQIHPLIQWPVERY